MTNIIKREDLVREQVTLVSSSNRPLYSPGATLSDLNRFRPGRNLIKMTGSTTMLLACATCGGGGGAVD
jgi:hypothetical protein